MPGKKSGSFDKEGIEGLAKNKPVVYEIENKKGDLLYTGVAKRGRVDERLKERPRPNTRWCQSQNSTEAQHC